MNRSALLTTILFLTLLPSCQDQNKSQERASETVLVKEKWHWGSETKQSENAGYAQVVKVGTTIYISGVPTSELDPGGVSRLYKTLGECLNTYGASFENVVKETLYTTDIEAMKTLNEVRKEFYKGDFPAATWVQVSRLYEPTGKLEVDLIAELTN